MWTDDLDQCAGVEEHDKENKVKALRCESLANPGGVVSDMEARLQSPRSMGYL